MEIKKGQVVWVNSRNGIEETKVVSSGRKYITLEWNTKIKFDKETLRQIGGCGFGRSVIVDIDKYNKDLYYNNLISRLENNFDWRNLSRDKLDEVAKLLNIKIG
jgi:hypothetical protein